MRVVGVDLAGSVKNDTGFCILTVGDDRKSVETSLLHSNDQLITAVLEAKSDLVAVDAPLIYGGVNRRCDELLREYGALPATLPGMETLARRGVLIAREFDKHNVKYIEVYATATAKILGVYHKKEFNMQKNMMSLDLDGHINDRLLVKDELDAISAALTAYLHLLGRTKVVGDESGRVVVPEV